jgi:hypothetical protein
MSQPIPQPVYICAPYRGDVAINRGNAIGLAVLAVRLGRAPVLPHVHDEVYRRAARTAEGADRVALACGLAQVRAVAVAGGELWVVETRLGLTSGCRAEVTAWNNCGGSPPKVRTMEGWAQWAEQYRLADVLR